MKASQIARGGMLTGASVVLLYLACTVPPARWAFCAAAGVVIAIPLAFGWVRMGVLMYCASGVLALLLVPDKRFAICHLILTGLYPLVKYAAEKRGKLLPEILIKFLFITVIGICILIFASCGFLPSLAEKMKDVQWYLLVIPFYAVYVLVDIALSRIIAGIRVLFAKK